MLKRYYILLFVFSLTASPCLAEDTWKFNLTSETKKLIDSPFFLITAADLNKNGKKEIIAADFGRFGDHFGQIPKGWREQWNKSYPPNYNLLLLEWDKSELKLKWKKQWDMTTPMSQEESDKYFFAYEASQFVAWSIGDRVIAETIPPYLGIEWVDGKYLLHEQHRYSGSAIGSWALPWLSPSCYLGEVGECIVGIRDFSGKGKPKIVTITTEVISKGNYTQTLRVRGFEPGFPVEWETAVPKRFAWWHLGWNVYTDRLNWGANSLLIFEFWRPQATEAITPRAWHLFEPEEKGKGYRLRPIQRKGAISQDLPPIRFALYDYPDVYLATYDLPDVYLRSTQKKGLEEYWGYHRVDIPNPERIDFKLLLGKVILKPDLTGFVKEVIDFPHHKQFLSVGYFDLKDIDNDGLDEVIMIEETGKKKFVGEEYVEYSDIKDYIHILKWDGKEYKAMWVSPPYTKRGTKFLIEDVKNTGKKQLVVMTPNGTIQIWERE